MSIPHIRLDRRQGDEIPLKLWLRYRCDTGIMEVGDSADVTLHIQATSTTPLVKITGLAQGSGHFEFPTAQIKDWTGRFPYETQVNEGEEWTINDGTIHSSAQIA